MQWINVKDEMPEPEKKVLAIVKTIDGNLEINLEIFVS